MTLVGTISDGNGFTVEIWATESNGSTTFTIKVAEGEGDLRGFFFDYSGGNLAVDAISGENVTAWDPGTSSDDPNDGTVTGKGKNAVSDDITQVGHNDNNMNGTGLAFDAGVQFGGPGDDGLNEVTFTIDGLTLAEIDDLNFGIRAKSIGEDGYSVKLVGQFDVPEEETPSNHFNPMEVGYVLLHLTNDDGDSIFAKIDGWNGEYDLDDYMDAFQNYITSHAPAGYELEGVVVKHGGGHDLEAGHNYYALDNDPNDDDNSAEIYDILKEIDSILITKPNQKPNGTIQENELQEYNDPAIDPIGYTEISFTDFQNEFHNLV